MSLRRNDLRSTSLGQEVLVGVLPRKGDVAILERQSWYRVPVDKAPRRWPPSWLAFYEGSRIGGFGGVSRYARVVRIEERLREELFPNEPPGRRAGRHYYKVYLDELKELPQAIRLGRPRPVVFISTTLAKLRSADSISDLFDDSPLEDQLWRAVKDHSLPAERQWPATVETRRYFVDVAVFCHSGGIALEADGDTWHANPVKSDKDNLRTNDLISVGWKVMHFTTRDIRERLSDQIEKIFGAINTMGGPEEKGLVGRRFVREPGGYAQQLALMEEPNRYDHQFPLD